MNRVAVAKELAKLAKELSAAGIDWERMNRIEKLMKLSVLVVGEERTISPLEITHANHALEQAEKAMIIFGRICLSGKKQFGQFRQQTEELERLLF